MLQAAYSFECQFPILRRAKAGEPALQGVCGRRGVC